MDRENEKEVFERASDSKARLNQIERLVSTEEAQWAVKEIRKNLEVIERRSDPARHPEYDPEKHDVRPSF